MSHEEPQPMPPEQEQPVSNRMGIRLNQPKEVGGVDGDRRRPSQSNNTLQEQHAR